jgi:RNA polymerase sigma-70 factor (ECF subfamily)
MSNGITTGRAGSPRVNDLQAGEPGPPDDELRSAAFNRYVEPEVAVLYRIALSLTRHHADAEDLVQDTLLKAYRAVDRFDGAYPRAWLLTILRNTHRNRLRIRLPSLLRDGDDTTLLEGEVRSAEELVVDAQFEASSPTRSRRCRPCTGSSSNSSTSTDSATPRPPRHSASRAAP